MRTTVTYFLGKRWLWPVVVAAVTAGYAGQKPAHSQSVGGSALTNAGGSARAGSYVLVSSLGEPVPGGVSAGGQFRLTGGFAGAFLADVLLPTIDHEPPAVQNIGEPVSLAAELGGAVRVEQATLFYGAGGSEAYASVPMNSDDGNTYRASVPGEAITPQGLAYYITAQTIEGNEARFPNFGVFSVEVAVPEPGLTFGEQLPGGTDPSAYRLISAPLTLEDGDPIAVFGDDLGPYDDTQWRLFELAFDQSAIEVPSISAMKPGKAYWLILKEGRSIDTGPGRSAPLDRSYGIALHPKWNLIGNPFGFPVPVESLRMKSGQPIEPRSYLGHWNDPVNDRVEGIQPFEGYAVFNSLASVDTLFVDPDVRGGAGGAGKRTAYAQVSQFEWMVKIHAETQGERDIDNIIATVDGASVDWDPLDYPEPPTPAERSLSVYFPHPEWSRLADTYSSDVRPAAAAGYTWTIEAVSHTWGEVRLTIDGLAGIGAEFEAWLIDDAAQVAQDLRQSNAYTFTGPGPGIPKALRVVIGREEYIKGIVGEQLRVPASFQVTGNFPNPFTTSTTIRYGVPEDEEVSIEVYNLLGRRVAVLKDRQMTTAGFHTAVWDGTSLGGELAPSGIYFVRLRAGELYTKHKLVLVR